MRVRFVIDVKGFRYQLTDQQGKLSSYLVFHLKIVISIQYFFYKIIPYNNLNIFTENLSMPIKEMVHIISILI